MTLAHVPVHKFEFLKYDFFEARTAQHRQHRTSLSNVCMESYSGTVNPSASELPWNSFYILTFALEHEGEGVRRVFRLERYCILVSRAFQDF